MKYLLALFFIANSVMAASDNGFVFSVSYSPKANESTFKRNDDQSSKTYKGNKFRAQAGYKFPLVSLLGNLEYADMSYKGDTTQERVDTNYGASLRFNPFTYFYLEGTYWITATELSYSTRASEDFAGEKVTVGAGIRIPTPKGPAFTIAASYILSSKMRKKGAGDSNVVDEEGYTISAGGTLSFSN